MIPLTIAGAAAVGVLLWAEWRHSLLRAVAKPAASVSFVGVALVADATATPYGRWVLAALVLSLAGDVALLGRSRPAFLAGLGSFLLAHVAYTAGFGARGLDGLVMVGALAAAAVVAVLVVRWLLPAVPAGLVGPVLGYAAVISLMAAAATATAAASFDAWIVGAAYCFYVSDLAVARDRFVAPGFANRLWGLPLYYAAQFAFAWTV